MNLEELLRQLREIQNSYQPNQQTLDILKTKELVLVVGPSAVGKDYVIDEIVKTQDGTAKARTFTSRPRRDDDDDSSVEFIQHTEEQLLEIMELAKAGKLVNIAVHPSSKYVYGTRIESFPAAINLLPTLSTAVDSLLNVGFGRTSVMGIVATPEEWVKRFSSRYSEGADRAKRIVEASQSISWLTKHADSVSFMYNRQGAPIEYISDQETAHRLLRDMAGDLPS